MRLSNIYRLQSELMTHLGVPPTRRDLDDPQLKDALIGVVQEATEALGPLSNSTKPWKPQDVENQRPHVVEEVVDVLFMTLECLILLGLSEREVHDAYQTKWQLNMLAAEVRQLPTTLGHWGERELQNNWEKLYTSLHRDFKANRLSEQNWAAATALDPLFDRHQGDESRLSYLKLAVHKLRYSGQPDRRLFSFLTTVVRMILAGKRSEADAEVQS